MPRVLTSDGYDFHLDIDIKPDIESSLKIVVSVRREPLKARQQQRETVQTWSALAKIEQRDGRAFLVVELDNLEVFAQPLDEGLGGDEVLNSIPGVLYGGGEPVVGCLIRGGLSAVVDQMKKCWATVREAAGFLNRLQDATKCIKEAMPSITLKAALRAGFCIAKGGA